MRSAPAVDQVLALFRRWGGDHYDEDVSQLAHALQTAALAAAAGAADSLVGAALLHDVGHLLQLASDAGKPSGSGGDAHHETLGADYLAARFAPAVSEPVRLHVQAKRYLCAADASYVAGLSAGSQRSLARQGGPMGADEMASFGRAPGFADAVRLRRWDDQGKVPGLAVAPLEHYRDLLDRCQRAR